MTAKKKWFKRRIGYTSGVMQSGNFYASGDKMGPKEIKLRVSDARELTPERAVEHVLQRLLNRGTVCEFEAKLCLTKTSMTATIRNGKVRVRMNKP